jgi:hypothetical protein
MESNHPYACYGSNNKKLSLDQRDYLLYQLKIYVEVIQHDYEFTDNTIQDAITQYINWNGTDEINDKISFIWISHMLLPQKYDDYLKKGFVNSIRPTNFQFTKRKIEVNIPNKLMTIDENLTKDLYRITCNHLEFCHRVKESNLLQKVISGANQLDMIFDEFNSFLNLGYSWNGDNFCPSMIIDMIWHASMLDNKIYNNLTTYFVGKLLPHCLEENENEEKQKSRYETFLKQYQYFHKRNPLQIANLRLEEEQDVFHVLENKYTQLQKEKEEYEKQQKLMREEEQRKLEEKNRQMQKEKEEYEKQQKVRREEEQRKLEEKNRQMQKEREILQEQWKREYQNKTYNYDDGKC